MKIVFIAPLLITFFCSCFCQKRNNLSNEIKDTKILYEEAVKNNSPVSPNQIEITQKDETKIWVIGKGNMHISYTETVDGYTIVRNKEDIYEYAVLDDTGDLIPTGIKARNVSERNEEENSFLKSVEKNLRYQSPKIDELIKQQKQFDYELNNR